MALLTMEKITFGIDSVWNFSLEVKENDELIIWISRHYWVDSCSVALTSFRFSKQKEIVMVDNKKNYILTMENITLVLDFK